MRGLANEDEQKNIPLGKTDYQAGDFLGDTKTVLDLEDDAAFCNWGGAWRMPTNEVFTTFLDGTSSYTKGGSFTHQGVTFPTAGFGDGTGLKDAVVFGYYWSSSLDTGNPVSAYYLFFFNGNVDTDRDARCLGRSVRPVSGSN